MKALRGEQATPPPVWLMRQAGRYLPEYRAVRGRARNFLELCYSPDLAVEITLQPIRRFGMDGAILFSDILVVPDALGWPVTFVEGEGPRLEPVRDGSAIARLSERALHERLGPVYETVRRLSGCLPDETALIGFAGAPWTLAAYMVEGQGSREFAAARAFARRERASFSGLIDLLTRATTAYLLGQIEAGAEVVQVFDSWAGVLPEPEFVRWCQEPVAAIVRELKRVRPEVPVIVFPRGAGGRYGQFARSVEADGVSLDTTVSLAFARRELKGYCLQGNLDPVALMVGGAALRAETSRILRAMQGTPFVFNLGHGVLPETDPASVAALVEQVRSTGK